MFSVPGLPPEPAVIRDVLLRRGLFAEPLAGTIHVEAVFFVASMKSSPLLLVLVEELLAACKGILFRDVRQVVRMSASKRVIVPKFVGMSVTVEKIS